MKIFVLIASFCLVSQAQHIVRSYHFSENITQILVGENDTIFVGTENGLRVFQKNTWLNYRTAADNRPLGKITALGQAPDGTLWVGKAGYYGQGIERLSQNNRWFSERLSTANKKLPGNYVTGLCLNQGDGFLITLQPDRSGQGGAMDMSLDEKSAQHWLRETAATSCLCTQTSCFVGTQNKGLFEFSHEGQVIWQLPISKPIVALAMDTKNRLWMGLKEGGGLMQHNLLSRETWLIQGLKDKNIRALLVNDKSNMLWIGTDKALFEMNLVDKSLKVFETIQDVHSLANDPQSQGLWVAAGKSLLGVEVNPKELTKADIKALKVIASRQGLNRLDYDESTESWSIFSESWNSQFTDFFFGKDRFDILVHLEHLAQSVEEGARISIAKDMEYLDLIKRAYASLLSLYEYYKDNPNADTARQTDFMRRYEKVLAKFKTVF